MKGILLTVAVITLALTGCKKSTPTPILVSSNVTAPAAGTNTTTTALSINSTAQVQFTLDGTAAVYVESLTAPAVINGQSEIGTINSAAGTMTVGTDFANSTGTIIKILKGTFHVPPGMGLDPDTEFSNFFPKTTHSYSTTASNGISITWYDASGNSWTTDNGTADQTGSSFTIIDNAKDYVRDSNGNLMMKVYATFNCKLYNTSGGVKTITNGKLVAYYSYN